jgi:signal transduction histidine kinase
VNTLPAVLVVDDYPENLVALAAVLDGPDRRLLRARSAREALEILLREPVAAAIVDVQMPEIDGFELAELMRGTARTRGVPIIFVTANDDEPRMFAGYESGAVDFLTKPVDPRVLRSKVNVFLELDRQRRQLAARVDELETVLAAVPAAVFMIRNTATGEVIGNDYAHEVLRLPRDDAPIPRGSDFFRMEKDGRELPVDGRPLQSTAADGVERRGFEMDVVFPDGERRHLFGNSTPLHGTDGRVRGAVAAYVDVTRIKEVEERLRELDRQKDAFLAALSHELRNPLMPIMTSVEVLRRAPADSPAGQRALAVVERQSRHLSRLVDDLLDLTRINNGKIQLRIERVDLATLLRAVAADHEPGFGEAGITFALDLPAEPAVVEADPARIVQVIGNLLGNAAKFTPRGGRVLLALAIAGTDARISVRDTGVGIAPAMLARLFQPFVQADTTLDRSRGGLGLGLAVVKSLVEMQGGSVAAASAGEGHGTEVTVRLPRAAGAEPQRRPPADAEDGAPARVRRVLIIEDNVDGAAMLADTIRLLGHEVAVVHEGARALDALRRHRPEVVFCDIGLPGMDGYAVADALRADVHGRTARLVALSGYATRKDRERALAAGFDEHLAKPPSAEALRSMIEASGTTITH